MTSTTLTSPLDELRKTTKITPSGQKVAGSVWKFTGNAKRNVHAMSHAKLVAIVISIPGNADQRKLHRRAKVELAGRIAR